MYILFYGWERVSLVVSLNHFFYYLCRSIMYIKEVMQYQQTVRKQYSFEGKGLHTGKVSKITINPAPVGTGIRFRRTDIGEDAVVEALADYVSNTSRSTTISKGEVSVVTIEHILSALTGLGVDNVLIDIDNLEVPILDGSAKPYTDAILADGLQVQDAPRKYITLDRVIEVCDKASGSFVRIAPADELSYEVTVDFKSKVVGVQTASWKAGDDYASEVGKCRTFVFFHEIEYLAKNNLIKGGDVDNALVIVEYPVTDEQVTNMANLFGVPKLAIREDGYLDNVALHYDNECSRHKLLDLMGDLRLCGGFLKAEVTAMKPGHGINSRVAQEVRKYLNVK